MIVTRDWLEAHATKNRGFTREQLKALGVRWPPKKGWKDRLVGKEISEAQKTAYEVARAKRAFRSSSVGEIYDESQIQHLRSILHE